MLNDRLNSLGQYPFKRLAALLEGIDPNPKLGLLDLAIGEPKLPIPKMVPSIILQNADKWNRYPPTAGTPEFRVAVKDWLSRRYQLPIDLLDSNKNIAPVSGTRTGLFMIAQAVVPSLKNGQRPIVVMPNPFYQVYAGAAAASGAETFFIPVDRTTNFLPNIDAVPLEIRDQYLQRTALAYVCSPNNPQGQCHSLEGMKMVIRLARQYDFTLVFDECYAEIYNTVEAPVGALQACVELAREFPTEFGHNPLANVVVFHSLSKRSSAPGLRSGFAAGDAAVIAKLLQVLEFGGTASPLPIMAAATALWQDEQHVKEIRESYRRNFTLAEEIIGGRYRNYKPAGGFFLWLEVGDGEAKTKKLWQEGHVRVLPGRFLSAPLTDFSRPAGQAGLDSSGGKTVGYKTPGDDFIRVALVHPPEVTALALRRLVAVLDGLVIEG
ncbi:MAG: aminotransferase class I/II-fold pyridoxal phosphate-dependent enzyme [Candidatus Pacebacteria bacterium]|nr:aminotransferase class I/II-fold pyridoxal phosphate-dependent enzyme [Candidatus Paceibacterota bacterium]